MKFETKPISIKEKEYSVKIQAHAVSSIDKKHLLVKQIEAGVEKSVVQEVLKKLELVEYQQLLDGKRPRIQVTEANELLLEVLLKRKWISSYEKDKDNSEYFQTYDKVVRKKKLE